MRDNFTICQNHNFIKDYLKRLKLILKRDKYLNEYAYGLINEGLATCRTAKKQGERMENRLKKYYKAINNLGWTRVNKQKSINENK